MSEPVMWQVRMRPDWRETWCDWQNCTAEQAVDYQSTPLFHDWHYETRALYTRPSPAVSEEHMQPTAEEMSELRNHLVSLARDRAEHIDIVFEMAALRARPAVSEEKIAQYIDFARKLESGDGIFDEPLSLPAVSEHLHMAADTIRALCQALALSTDTVSVPKDGERLRYVMQDLDGFVHVGKDKHDYAMEVAAENGRDEPSAEDELEGIHRLIDAAREAENV